VSEHALESDRVSWPLRVPGRLDQLLGTTAAALPGRTAFADGAGGESFAALNRRVDAAAAALRELLPTGGTVAVAAVLHPDFAVAYYAASRAGLVSAVVNPFLREEDLLHVLRLSGAALVFADHAMAPRIDAIQHGLPALRQVVLFGPGDTRRGERPDLASLLAAGYGRDPAPGRPGPGELASIQFTSGTTGLPKGVRLTHRNLTVNAAQVAGAHRLNEACTALNHLPTFHPMHLNSAILAGAAQLLCPDPEPTRAAAVAGRNRVTHFYSLPVRLMRLAADPAAGMPPGIRIGSGGSALPATIAQRLTARFDARVFQGYGLAETSPLTHCDDPERPVHGSAGRPVHGTECRVVDVETRAVLDDPTVGEIQVRGPQLMAGYLGAADGSGLESDGWFSTGDVGRIDESGRLYLIDRLGDVFKCDGFLVAPSEVERVLQRHPAVRECVVLDLPDQGGGPAVGALVVLDPDHAGSADLPGILRGVNADLPYYKQVRHAAVIEEIPRAGNGKIRRRDLRGMLAAAARPGSGPEHPAHSRETSLKGSSE
jgi:long-chain acyl-CoA synthetase